MTVGFQKGRYLARRAITAADLRACQALRHRCFFGADGLDRDRFDPDCAHLMVEDGPGGPLVCTLRYRISNGAGVGAGYAAQFYDLSAFAKTTGPLMEIGRFCADPAAADPHILRVAWGALTAEVDRSNAQVLFGCTSFPGLAPEVYARAFGLLVARGLGPACLKPGKKAAQTVQLQDVVADGAVQRPMPPLLRTYLAMGGWVSDHAVVDLEMRTLHVLTALEIAKVPPARAKALRALV